LQIDKHSTPLRNADLRLLTGGSYLLVKYGLETLLDRQLIERVSRFSYRVKLVD
jgi:hypothetical protein